MVSFANDHESAPAKTLYHSQIGYRGLVPRWAYMNLTNV